MLVAEDVLFDRQPRHGHELYHLACALDLDAQLLAGTKRNDPLQFLEPLDLLVVDGHDAVFGLNAGGFGRAIGQDGVDDRGRERLADDREQTG